MCHVPHTEKNEWGVSCGYDDVTVGQDKQRLFFKWDSFLKMSLCTIEFQFSRRGQPEHPYKQNCWFLSHCCIFGTSDCWSKDWAFDKCLSWNAHSNHMGCLYMYLFKCDYVWFDRLIMCKNISVSQMHVWECILAQNHPTFILVWFMLGKRD